MAKSGKASTYTVIIDEIFREKYRKGCAHISFEREDLRRAETEKKGIPATQEPWRCDLFRPVSHQDAGDYSKYPSSRQGMDSFAVVSRRGILRYAYGMAFGKGATGRHRCWRAPWRRKSSRSLGFVPYD